MILRLVGTILQVLQRYSPYLWRKMTHVVKVQSQYNYLYSSVRIFRTRNLKGEVSGLALQNPRLVFQKWKKVHVVKASIEIISIDETISKAKIKKFQRVQLSLYVREKRNHTS